MNIILLLVVENLAVLLSTNYIMVLDGLGFKLNNNIIVVNKLIEASGLFVSS